MPRTEGIAEMSLEAANKAAILMVEDHPKNLHRHEMKLHALSAKAERLVGSEEKAGEACRRALGGWSSLSVKTLSFHPPPLLGSGPGP